jgi:NAD(P)-dependent dehydrogenase (short-subunit alcohol dehydrogenase family)
MDTKVLDQMLALNLRSGYLLSRASAKEMLQQGSGVIVNVASKAALDHAPSSPPMRHRRRRR